jgi:hypothetical protein
VDIEEMSLEELNAIKSMQEISLIDSEFVEAEKALSYLFEKDLINKATKDLIHLEIERRHKEHFTFRTKPFRTCDAMNYTAYTFMRVLISKLREPGGG